MRFPGPFIRVGSPGTHCTAYVDMHALELSFDHGKVVLMPGPHHTYVAVFGNTRCKNTLPNEDVWFACGTGPRELRGLPEVLEKIIHDDHFHDGHDAFVFANVPFAEMGRTDSTFVPKYPQPRESPCPGMVWKLIAVVEKS